MNDAQDFLDPDNITNSEFRQQIKNWIEEQGIHANLQLQMKKDLIDQISRTAMGRKISLKMQTHQGIVLSPLVLVLNTLVAEFLYTQNCHFSLSVFSNEVPFKNTLPDFGRSKHFRLNRQELKEIFEALGVEHYAGLVEKYESKPTKQGGKSLLYIIVKSLLASVKAYEEKFQQLKKEETERDATKNMMDGLEIDKLHKNVEKLLQRMKLVGKSIQRVEELHHTENRDEEQSTSLKVCTESVTRMVSRLEVYSKTLEDLIVKLQIQTEKQEVAQEKKVEEEVKPVEVKETKSYTDFLNELKSTEHGQKYVAKLQKQVLKMLDKEKAKMEAKYEKKMHAAEMEYKSKLERVLSERIREISTSRDKQISPKPIESKVIESDESIHFMKKIDEKLNQLYQHERNVDEKLVTLKNDLQKHELRQSKYFQSLKAAETKEKKLLVLQDVERQLLATFEDETQAIIQNAKATIEHLESESDKINRSFQKYLQKQREDKMRLIDEKIQIWQKYNDEKLELNQRELMGLNGHAPQDVVIKETFQPHQEEFPEMGNFENPFKNFDPHKYLRRPQICNIVLDTSKKQHEVADAAVNTTIEAVEGANLKPPAAEQRKAISPNMELLEKARLDHEVHKSLHPIVVQESISTELRTIRINDPKLSDLLAKDTANLKRSIEENLQKLDQMSKTYTKSTSTTSSERDKQKSGGTYNVKPTIDQEPQEPQRSLDDLSSGELGLSDGELSMKDGLSKPEKPIDLDSTKELLEYTRKNFPESSEGRKDDVLSLGSLSDLEVSGDSKSNASERAIARDDSVGDILEDISTGKRSLSDNSWN